MQRVVDAVEVVEEAGHRRDFDNLPFIVVLLHPLEQGIVDCMGVDGQLLRPGQRRLLRFAERTLFEVQQRRQLALPRSVPRSLRGV